MPHKPAVKMNDNIAHMMINTVYIPEVRFT